MAGIVVSPQWARLIEDDLRGTVRVIGAANTKSTLSRYLFLEPYQHGRYSAYVDLDVGQSTLGPPTALNLALAREPGGACFPSRGPQAASLWGRSRHGARCWRPCSAPID